MDTKPSADAISLMSDWPVNTRATVHRFVPKPDIENAAGHAEITTQKSAATAKGRVRFSTVTISGGSNHVAYKHRSRGRVILVT